MIRSRQFASGELRVVGEADETRTELKAMQRASHWDMVALRSWPWRKADGRLVTDGWIGLGPLTRRGCNDSESFALCKSTATSRTAPSPVRELSLTESCQGRYIEETTQVRDADAGAHAAGGNGEGGSFLRVAKRGRSPRCCQFTEAPDVPSGSVRVFAGRIGEQVHISPT